ncbi:MAG: hypothetical protein IPI49_12415 [Myxococcales bacterium]|nr:hypothetical protein [Myxococcales bacterium]HRC55734.1 hypothetical protein [Kofleriaceae bacterium]
MRFCPWYPLDEASQRTPAAPNVLQVRVAIGLCPYPRGKSAMVHYQVADDARAAAVTLAARFRGQAGGQALWCRHLTELEAELEADLPAHLHAHYTKLLGDFVRRFGAAPSYPEELPAG